MNLQFILYEDFIFVINLKYAIYELELIPTILLSMLIYLLFIITEGESKTCESGGQTYLDQQEWYADSCTFCRCFRGNIGCKLLENCTRGNTI